MRRYFFAILCLCFLKCYNASAQGLSANPWLSRGNASAAQNGAVYQNTSEYIPSSAQNLPAVQNTTPAVSDYATDMQELQNITDTIKERWAQNNNRQAQSGNTGSQNDEVSAMEAYQAFSTLHKYMNQNNSAADTQSANKNSAGFVQLKNKFQHVMNKKDAATIPARNSVTNFYQPQLNKAKNKYRHYKSQATSNYNTLKNKTQPLVNAVKKSMDEAEKATGIKF